MVKELHVVKRERDWAIEEEGRKTPVVTARTKDEARSRASDLARERGAEVVVHRTDGSVQDRVTPAPAGAEERARSERRAQRDLHVVPRDDGWAVNEEGKDHATAVFASKYNAITFARERAREEESDVVIHRADGSVQARFNPVHDPWRPTILYLGS